MIDTGGPGPQNGGAAQLEDIEQDFDRMDSALAALDSGDLDLAEALSAELGTSGAGGDIEARHAGTSGAGGDIEARHAGTSGAGGDIEARHAGTSGAGGDIEARSD